MRGKRARRRERERWEDSSVFFIGENVKHITVTPVKNTSTSTVTVRYEHMYVFGKLCFFFFIWPTFLATFDGR